MGEVYVVGIGMTKFGLFMERSVKEMVREAVNQSLTDSGAAVSDIEALFFSNYGQGVIEGQTGVPGQTALRPLGFQGAPIVNLENGCASASSAFYLACMQVRAGMADFALAVGVEKLSTPNIELRDKVFHGGMDVNDVEGTFDRLKQLGRGVDGPEPTGDRSIFMDIYSYWTRGHMRDFGSTQHQLAAIASKNHWHSSMNPLCQFQRQFTVEEVLAARRLSYPLTVPMCSPYSDGAAVAIVCSEKGLAKLGRSSSRPVKVESCVLRSGVDRSLEAFWDIRC